MGPLGRPETSVINYRYSLRNDPEERCSHLLQLFSLHTEMCIGAHALRRNNRDVSLVLCFTPPFWLPEFGGGVEIFG